MKGNQAKAEHHCKYCWWDVFPLSYSVEPVVKELSEQEIHARKVAVAFRRWLYGEATLNDYKLLRGT